MKNINNVRRDFFFFRIALIFWFTNEFPVLTDPFRPSLAVHPPRSQVVFDYVIRGKGDSGGDGAFYEVHRQPFVKPFPPFCPKEKDDRRPHGPVFHSPVLQGSRLHPPSDDVEGVSERLTRKSRAGAVQDTLEVRWVADSVRILVMILFQSFVDEERRSGVRDDSGHGRDESSVQRPPPFLLHHFAEDRKDGAILAPIGDSHSGASEVERVSERRRGGTSETTGDVTFDRSRSLSLSA